MKEDIEREAYISHDGLNQHGLIGQLLSQFNIDIFSIEILVFEHQSRDEYSYD